MKRLLLCLLIPALLMGLAACDDPAEPVVTVSDSPSVSIPVSSAPTVVVNAQDLVVSLGAGLPTLDPAAFQTGVDATVLCHLFEGLITLDADGTPVPGQAESYVFNDDYTSCTFTLREGLLWSDGKPLTADDFVYAWRRAVSTAGKEGSNAFLFSLIEGYRQAVRMDDDLTGVKTVDPDALKVEATDDRTLTVGLTGDARRFLLSCATPAYFPVRQDIAEQTPNWTRQPSTLVGNGPYTVTACKQNAYVRLARNPHYRAADGAGPQTIEFVLGGNALSMISAFQKGELMFVDGVPFAELSLYQTSTEYYSQGQLGTAYVGFNTTRAPVDDRAVRQALSLAIDRDRLCKQITMEGDTVATALVCDGVGDAAAAVEFRAAGNGYFGQAPLAEQVRQARELLKNAGVTDRHPLPDLTWLVPDSDREIAVATAVASDWQTLLGVACQVVPCDADEFAARRDAQDYDLISDRYVDTFNDPAAVLRRFTSHAPNNIALFADEDYDALLDEAAAKLADDRAAAYRLYHQAEDTLMEQAVVCPLYFLHSEHYLKHDGLDGFILTPLGYKFFMHVTDGTKNDSHDAIPAPVPSHQ